MTEGGTDTTLVIRNPGLIADLVQAQVKFTQNTTRQVIDHLESQLVNKQAELEAIRTDVMHLLSGMYMPMPHMIERALFPSSQRIEVERAQN
jgi:hypothetical protein